MSRDRDVEDRKESVSEDPEPRRLQDGRGDGAEAEVGTSGAAGGGHVEEVEVDDRPDVAPVEPEPDGAEEESPTVGQELEDRLVDPVQRRERSFDEQVDPPVSSVTRPTVADRRTYVLPGHPRVTGGLWAGEWRTRRRSRARKTACSGTSASKSGSRRGSTGKSRLVARTSKARLTRSSLSSRSMNRAFANYDLHPPPVPVRSGQCVPRNAESSTRRGRPLGRYRPGMAESRRKSERRNRSRYSRRSATYWSS